MEAAEIVPTPLPTSVPVVEARTREEAIDRWIPLLKKYWGSHWQDAKKVMGCESSGNPAAHNDNWKTGGHDDSWGLFQINLIGNLKNTRPAPELLIDPEFNIRYAFSMFRAQGWKPWSCKRVL